MSAGPGGTFFSAERGGNVLTETQTKDTGGMFLSRGDFMMLHLFPFLVCMMSATQLLEPGLDNLRVLIIHLLS